MTSTYRHDPAFLKAVETLIQTIQFDVNGTAGKGGNGGLTSDKAIRQSGELNIMIDRIKKAEAATEANQLPRQSFERAVVARLMESGFLEIEIRTECLMRCGDGYQDEVINAGWHYWNASLENNSRKSEGLRIDASNHAADAESVRREGNAEIRRADETEAEVKRLRASVEELRGIVSKVNEIRNSIIGSQTMNWSEHIYPLVAALENGGVKGMEYPAARENIGTLIDRTNAAEARAEALEIEVKKIREVS